MVEKKVNKGNIIKGIVIILLFGAMVSYLFYQRNVRLSNSFEERFTADGIPVSGTAVWKKGDYTIMDGDRKICMGKSDGSFIWVPVDVVLPAMGRQVDVQEDKLRVVIQKRKPVTSGEKILTSLERENRDLRYHLNADRKEEISEAVNQ